MRKRVAVAVGDGNRSAASGDTRWSESVTFLPAKGTHCSCKRGTEKFSCWLKVCGEGVRDGCEGAELVL